ncbi:hypothetical protein Tco_0836307 [Tanacetum coccineum]
MEEYHLLLTDQVYLVNPEGHRVVPDVSKPLPFGGPLGQVTIQAQYFFNKDLEYLVSGDKGRRSALSISKLKAAQYLDFRLEELVSSLWIEIQILPADSQCSSPQGLMKDRGYFLKRVILLTELDYKEYKISEADFKNPHPNDFEDMYLLHLQCQAHFYMVRTSSSLQRSQPVDKEHRHQKMCRRSAAHD